MKHVLIGSPVQLAVGANATGVTATGLLNGASHTFTAHATHAKGNGSEWMASNAATPVGPPSTTNVALAMTAPLQASAAYL